MTQVYSVPAAQQWLAQIEQVCAEAGLDHVDILLDQADWIDAAMPVLHTMRPIAPWFSLFKGMPEENLWRKGPLLIRLDITQPEHNRWLKECLCYYSTVRLLIVISPLPFKTLCAAAQALTQAERGGQVGLLRYYDPRIFPVLMSSILTEAQRSLFLRIARCWSWLDRDEQPQWLLGECESQQMSIKAPEWIQISDRQADGLGAVSDAHLLMKSEEFLAMGSSYESRFLRLYQWGVQAADENYYGDFAEYVRGQV